MPPSKSRVREHGRGLRVIAAFKLIKGLALLALGFGALHFLHKNLETEVIRWISVFQVDPHGRYLQLLLEKLSLVDDKKLKELSIGTFIYSGLFLTEGFGLAMRQRWAEYLTIVSTASLLPLEIYELVRHVTPAKGLALAINLAVVAYLVFELRRFPKHR